MLRKVVLIGLVLMLSGILPFAQAQEERTLTPGIPVSAAISESGEADTYEFRGLTGERVIITVSATEGSSLDTVLHLYDPANQLIAENDDAEQSLGKGSQIEITLPADGTYQVVVSAFADVSTGDYELLLTMENTPEFTSKGTLTVGEAVRSTLEPEQFDIWEFTPEADVLVEVSMASTEFDTLLEVFDSAGNFVAGDDDGGENTDSRIYHLNLQSGETYQIRANSYDNRSSGEYTLLIENAPEPPATVQISYGDTVEDMLTPGQRFSYEFEGLAGDFVTVEVSSEFDAYLELLNDRGDLVAQDDDGGGNFQPYLYNVELPESGLYVLIISGYDPASEGQFSLTLLTGEAPTVAQDISYGDTVNGFLSAGDEASYFFEGNVGDVISIAVVGGFDSILELYANDGSLLAVDDDSGGNFNPLIENVELADSGRHQIVIRGFSTEVSGRYELTLRQEEAGIVANGEEPVASTVHRIAYGETAQGVIQSDAPIQFEFEGRSGDVISITIRSDFDSTLEIIAPSGITLMFDDDSGGNFQPAVNDLELEEEGIYTINLRGYSSSDTGYITIWLSSSEVTVEGPGQEAPAGNSIAYGETFEGELEPGIDAELSFTASAGDVVTIAAVSEYDGYLELYDPAGERIASDDDGGEDFNPLLQNITLAEAGTYTIIFKAFGGQGRGPFTVTLTAGETTVTSPETTPEPQTGSVEETPAPAQAATAIVYGDRVVETLGAGEVRVFTFEAQAGDQISVMAAPSLANAPAAESALDLFIEVYNPSGELLAVDDDGGWRANPALVGLQLTETGTHRIEVRSFSGLDTGEFTLALESGAVYIAPDGVIAESLDVTTSPQITLDAGDLAMYSFTADAGVVITAVGEGVSFEIYAADGGTDYVVEGNTFTVSASGTYLLVATTTPNQGGTATISTTSQPAVSAEPTTTLMGAVLPDEPISGELQVNETQVWTFTPLQTGEYSFLLTSTDPSSNYDPYLSLRTAAGSLIAVDDDQGGNFDALIANVALKGGETFQIEATSFAGQVGGSYTLAVVTESVEEIADLEGGDLTLDTAATATLEAAGQQVIFNFAVENAGTYSFAVEGLSLPVIDLYDEAGNLIARGTNVLNEQKLEAGEYKVYIYNRLNQSGTFALTVTQAEEE